MEAKTEYKAASDTVPFKERVNRLVRELERAIRFDRPSILLAIYQSELVRAEAERAIAQQLHEMGQRTERVTINEQKHDLPLYLVQQSDHKKTVYFVQGLQWGGGEDGRNAYRALNIRREYFVDYRLRFILWLTEKEAYNLPRYAPDFWAFRHRVVEFFDLPQKDQINKYAHILTFRELAGHKYKDDTETKIGYRERLLTELPENSEFISQRIDLLNSLGLLYLIKEDCEASISNFKAGLSLAKKLAIPHVESLFHYGLGLTYEQLYQYEDAIREFQKASQLDPTNPMPFVGLGDIYQQLSKYQEALTTYQKALAIFEENEELSALFNPAVLYYEMGNTFSSLGRIEEAISAYQKSIDLDDSVIRPYILLALLFAIQEQTDKALDYLEKGPKLAPQLYEEITKIPGFSTLSRHARFQELISKAKIEASSK